MVIEPAPGEAASTRRALLRTSGTALAAGAGVAVTGCGGSRRPDVRTIPASARNVDVVILNDLLARAERTIAAYTACVPLFHGRLHAAGKQFLDQDLAHAGELYRLIKQAGGKTIKPRPSYDLGQPQGRQDLVRLLHTLEQGMVARYIGALPSLSPGSVRAAVASILANDAQHVVILRLSLRLQPIPRPFVTGAE